MKKLLNITILSMITISSLQAGYYFRTDIVKKVLPVVEKDFRKCLEEKKLTVNQCHYEKDKTLNKLKRIDEQQYRFEIKKQIKEDLKQEDPEKRVILKPITFTPTEMKIRNNYEKCLDKMKSKKDFKKCQLDFNEEYKKELTKIKKEKENLKKQKSIEENKLVKTVKKES